MLRGRAWHAPSLFVLKWRNELFFENYLKLYNVWLEGVIYHKCVRK